MYNCCICYTKRYVTKTICNHNICINCLMNLKKIICPLCRKDLKKEMPKNLLKYLNNKNSKDLESKSMYLRFSDIEEFPPLP